MRCIFLHGLAGEPEDFAAVRVHLSGWRVAAPAIDYFSGRFESLDDLARMVRKSLAPEFQDPSCLVIGNSLGGVLALALAKNYVHAVLAGSHIRMSSGFVGRGSGVLATELARIFHDPARLSAARIRRYEERWQAFASSRAKLRQLRPLKRMVQSFDGHGLYRRLQGRLTLVCGASDAISPLDCCKELVAQYPGMGMEVLEDCGHAVPIERPQALARVLRRVHENLCGADPAAAKKRLRADLDLGIVSSCAGGKRTEIC